MGMRVTPFGLMVVFQVEQIDLAFDEVDAKCQAAIGGDAQAPDPFAPLSARRFLLSRSDGRLERLNALLRATGG